MTQQLASEIFVALIAVAASFQMALALGAPWGELAMGGALPGAFSPALRLVALANAIVLILTALVVLSRAGLALRSWRRASRWLVWLIVGLFAIGVVLNLMTPSVWERLIWAPVAAGLFLSALRVALGR